MLRGHSIRLRGIGLGNWLNLEHFMLGIPGTDGEIRAAIETTYGPTDAQRFWNRYHSIYTAEADLEFVRALGLNSVRIPINFSRFALGDEDLAAESILRELDRALAYASRCGLLVIIDLHAAPGGQNPDWHCDNATGAAGFWQDEAHRTKVIRLWERLASHYCDNTTVAGYDLLNEPCFLDDANGSLLVGFYEACIAAIRRVDPHHIIFIEGNRYARDFSMFQRNLDDQIAYCLHYYPFLQLPNELRAPNAGVTLRERLFVETSLAQLVDDLQKPIWCGETGHALHLSDSAPILLTFLRMLEELNVSWALWPLKDARAMGLLTPKHDSPWMRLVRSASGNWSFWELFSRDSVLAASEQSDPLAYYRRLAELTSNAHARFRQRLSEVPFEVLLSALESFAFSACDRQATLIDIVHAVVPRSP
jgi:endoglucanase